MHGSVDSQNDYLLTLVSLPADIIEVSVVMPCLNEAETVQECVLKAVAALQHANLIGEVIVADNGSTDGSQILAESAGARLVHVSERGYGAALRAGFQAARGKYIVMADSDGSYDFDMVPEFVETLRQGYHLVMGTRLKGKIVPGAMPFLHQYLGNPVLTFLGNLVTGSRVSDYHCGMRGFDANAVRALGLVTSGMELATEMVVRFSLKRHRIAELPITLYPDGRSRKPHLRTWRDGWRHLKIYLLFSPNWLFFLPAMIILTLGVGIYFVQVVQANPDPTPFFVALGAIVAGIELCTLGIFARFYLYKNGITVQDRLSYWMTNHLDLNDSLLVSIIVGFLGLVMMVIFFSNPPLLILALIVFILGANILLGSLLLGLLNLDHHFK